MTVDVKVMVVTGGALGMGRATTGAAIPMAWYRILEN